MMSYKIHKYLYNLKIYLYNGECIEESNLDQEAYNNFNKYLDDKFTYLQQANGFTWLNTASIEKVECIKKLISIEEKFIQ